MIELSDDAKAVLGGLFAIMSRSSKAIFNTPSRIAPRSKAALDELVAAQAISVEPYRGGVLYRPLIDTTPYMDWLRRNGSKGKFPITVD